MALSQVTSQATSPIDHRTVSRGDSYAPPNQATYPSYESYTQYPSNPSYPEGEPDGRRRRRRHHPIRTLVRFLADIFIVFWALLNTIENWPQEWNSIKETYAFVYILVVLILHHFGVH